MRKIHALAAASALAAAGVAGCTPPSTQTVLSDIQAGCAILPIATTITVLVESSIPGAAIAAPITQVIGSDAAPICTGVVQAVQAIVADINAKGGTATVTVTTAKTSGAKSKYKMTFAPGSKVYILPPILF